MPSSGNYIELQNYLLRTLQYKIFLNFRGKSLMAFILFQVNLRKYSAEECLDHYANTRKKVYDPNTQLCYGANTKLKTFCQVGTFDSNILPITITDTTAHKYFAFFIVLSTTKEQHYGLYYVIHLFNNRVPTSFIYN